MQSNARSIASRTPGSVSVRRMSCLPRIRCPLQDRLSQFINRYVMHIIYCAQVCLCSHVVIDRLFSHSKYPSYHLAPPHSAPPITSPYRFTIRNSYSVPAVGAGNDLVRIFLADFACSFLSRTQSMKERPSCFLFEIVLLFTFLLLPFYFLPFPLRYFTSTSRLRIGCHLELYDPCLQAQQVRVCGRFLFVIPGATVILSATCSLILFSLLQLLMKIRVSCMWVLSLFWSMRRRLYSCPMYRVSPFFLLSLPHAWRCSTSRYLRAHRVCSTHYIPLHLHTNCHAELQVGVLFNSFVVISTPF